jgi:hypothetical protein
MSSIQLISSEETNDLREMERVFQTYYSHMCTGVLMLLMVLKEMKTFCSEKFCSSAKKIERKTYFKIDLTKTAYTAIDTPSS